MVATLDAIKEGAGHVICQAPREALNISGLAS